MAQTLCGSDDEDQVDLVVQPDANDKVNLIIGSDDKVDLILVVGSSENLRHLRLFSIFAVNFFT